MTEVKSESSVFDALANKVSSYMAGKHLSVTGFSREAGVDRGVVFRLVRDRKPITTNSMLRMGASLETPTYIVIGYNTGKVYFVGAQHSDCSRWINNLAPDSKTKRLAPLRSTEPLEIFKESHLHKFILG
ncbi:hypothetical protein [Lacticaseibacillus manihotivorans]|uniref:hypothetical protein n=1 Tax=Lacticaseibacillus manihotivorans TaxID=88233 RepID=UPI0006D1E62F|nr:hypothetical protein [Lacticaseibacillus manihotivorans]